MRERGVSVTRTDEQAHSSDSASSAVQERREVRRGNGGSGRVVRPPRLERGTFWV